MSNDNTEQKTKWDLPRFIQALCKRKPEEEAWFKRYLNIGNDRIETKYRNPDYSDPTLKDFVEADEKYLYCGEVKPDLPTVFEGVEWDKLTDEKVESWITDMVNNFALYEVGKATALLASINLEDTSKERGEKLKEVVTKLMPEKIESYIDLSHDMPERDLLITMKHNLIEYIASI